MKDYVEESNEERLSDPWADAFFAEVIDENAERESASPGIYGQFDEFTSQAALADTGEAPLRKKTGGEKEGVSESKLSIALLIGGIAILVILAALCGYFLGTIVSKAKAAEADPGYSANFDYGDVDKRQIAKLEEIYRYICENYYIAADPDELIEGAVRGMAESIDDPYGSYYRPGKMSDYTDYVSGKTLEKTVYTGDLGDGLLYLRIEQFTGETADEFRSAIDGYPDAKGLIIDVRKNPGGYVSSAVKICDMILPEGTVSVAKTRDGTVHKTYTSDRAHLDIPVAVLVDGGSASASELLTGAIRDFGAGTVIGVTTYGKALGQISKTFDYDGSGISLSAYRYYTPSGECIDGVGITPDIVVEALEEYVNARPADVPRESDVQLQKAVEVLKK